MYMDHAQLLFFSTSGLFRKGQARALSLIQKMVVERARKVAMKENNLLSEVELFKGLAKSKIDCILDSMELVHYRPGEVIVQENDLALDFFVIVKGEVEIRKGGVVMASKVSHDMFGENALSVQKLKALRTATVAARIHTDCYKLSRSKLKSLVADGILSENMLTNFQNVLKSRYDDNNK